MNATRLKGIVSLGGALALTSFNTVGGPLTRADVAADPSWMLHIDIDGLRPSALGQFIQQEMNKPEAQTKLSAFQAVVSFDLRTQLQFP